MSSKVLPPDDPQVALPISWRRVDLPEKGQSYTPPFPSVPQPGVAPVAKLVAAPRPAAATPAAPAAPAPTGKPAAPDPRQVEASAVEAGIVEASVIEAKLREARAAGVREGEAAGRSKAAAEMQPVIDRLTRSIEEISGLRARLRREAEQDLIRLALAIARRVIRRELAVDPDALHGLVLGALEKLQGQEICRVRVHPSHAATVSASLRQLAAASPVEVIPDATRQPGTVIFETDRGNLDASIESQLREIENGLGDRLRNSQ
jgi:flagellar assembly protein FliH